MSKFFPTKVVSWSEAVAGDGGAIITVPQGVKWRLKQATGYITTFVAMNPFTAIQLNVPEPYRDSGGPNGAPFAAGLCILSVVKTMWNDTGATVVADSFIHWTGDIILPPGSTISCIDMAIGIPPANIAIQVVVEESPLEG